MTRVDPRRLKAAWALARRHGLDLFRPGASEGLLRLPGWSGLRLPGADLCHEPTATVLDALRALELQARETESACQSIRVVGTFPGRRHGLPGTRDVVRSLIAGAHREILVVGFTISDREFQSLLVSRAQDGLEVSMFLDRNCTDVAALAQSWPRKATTLAVFRNVEEQPPQRRSLHAKAIVADQKRALVGSANFTLSGLDHNMELGLLLEGPPAAEICRVVQSLAQEGWFEPIRY